MLTLAQLDPAEYAGYFTRYVANISPNESPETALRTTHDRMVDFYGTLTADQLQAPYAPGKWTPKQVLRHLIDTERVLTYRALRFARHDATPLPGFEQDDYVANSHANEEAIADLLAEFTAVRTASQLLFKSLSPTEAARHGTASGLTLSARALAFVVAGHDRHHLRIFGESGL